MLSAAVEGRGFAVLAVGSAAIVAGAVAWLAPTSRIGTGLVLTGALGIVAGSVWSARVTGERSSGPRQSPRTRKAEAGARPVFVYGYLLLLTIVVTDVTGFFRLGPSIKYVLAVPGALLALFGGLALLRARSKPLAWADVFLLILLIYGCLGSLTSQLSLSGGRGALPLLIPMAGALSHLSVPEGFMSEAGAGRCLKILGNVLIGYTFLHALSFSPWGAGLAAGYNYTHEKAFYGAGAVVAAIMLRSWVRLSLTLACLAYIVSAYAAATYPVVAVVTVAALVLARGRGRRVLATGATILGVAAAVATIRYLEQLARLAGWYLRESGKGDNTGTRLELWRQAVERISLEPVYGQLWRGEFTGVTAIRASRQAVPFHNDYLQLGVAGGLTAVLLFVGFLILANQLLLHRLAMLRVASPERWALGTTLYVILACAMIVALFNPVLFNFGSSTVVFLTYAACREVTRAPQVAPPRPSSPAVQRAASR